MRSFFKETCLLEVLFTACLNECEFSVFIGCRSHGGVMYSGEGFHVVYIHAEAFYKKYSDHARVRSDKDSLTVVFLGYLAQLSYGTAFYVGIAFSSSVNSFAYRRFEIFASSLGIKLIYLGIRNVEPASDVHLTQLLIFLYIHRECVCCRLYRVVRTLKVARYDHIHLEAFKHVFA